ncbi:MAG: sulfatase-like hydrolase/transferase [Chromatiales bacterium]|nr:sulfatase-like hydrolase/transferase [Chromatiales bacterium]
MIPFKRPPAQHRPDLRGKPVRPAIWAAFGNTEGLTPRLDALAKEGLLFTQLYATGTRTVRGLEALSLGTPPIPGPGDRASAGQRAPGHRRRGPAPPGLRDAASSTAATATSTT